MVGGDGGGVMRGCTGADRRMAGQVLLSLRKGPGLARMMDPFFSARNTRGLGLNGGDVVGEVGKMGRRGNEIRSRDTFVITDGRYVVEGLSHVTARGGRPSRLSLDEGRASRGERRDGGR